MNVIYRWDARRMFCDLCSMIRQKTKSKRFLHRLRHNTHACAPRHNLRKDRKLSQPRNLWYSHPFGFSMTPGKTCPPIIQNTAIPHIRQNRHAIENKHKLLSGIFRVIRHAPYMWRTHAVCNTDQEFSPQNNQRYLYDRIRLHKIFPGISQSRQPSRIHRSTHKKPVFLCMICRDRLISPLYSPRAQGHKIKILSS
jgi:hypothetical protein